MKTLIRSSFPYRVVQFVRSHADWRKRAYAAPSPHFIKQACLLRNGIPNATWVETGTHLGDTTQLLAKHASKVYSIEPETKLFARARQRFSGVSNIEIINGTSESVFPTLLPKLGGDVNFWLDGHYSGGNTFQGAKNTPILEEIQSITANRGRFRKLCVLIDDIRCFQSNELAFSAYPSLDVLVGWARDIKLDWHIEHDIFVAKN